MMATLRRFMAVLLVNGGELDRSENRDPYFAVQTLKSGQGLEALKRKPGQRDRATPYVCGAIYSEKAKKQCFVWGLVSRIRQQNGIFCFAKLS
jgi:hypothetical protein